MTLKRDAQMPLYQQMANEIKAQIASGELRQNEQLMTEMELSREFGVSRITVRKALELLVEEDILSKRQGVGKDHQHQLCHQGGKHTAGYGRRRGPAASARHKL